jgi:hypothetical protein
MPAAGATMTGANIWVQAGSCSQARAHKESALKTGPGPGRAIPRAWLATKGSALVLVTPLRRSSCQPESARLECLSRGDCCWWFLTR